MPSGENQWSLLSHLEYLIRLTMMENYLQTSCTNVTDEMIILFLQSSFSNAQNGNSKVIRSSSSSEKSTSLSNLSNIKLIGSNEKKPKD